MAQIADFLNLKKHRRIVDTAMERNRKAMELLAPIIRDERDMAWKTAYKEYWKVARRLTEFLGMTDANNPFYVDALHERALLL
jgi:hypothetical protein